MAQYVWCKNEECRIPLFRCMLCRSDCYAMRARGRQDELGKTFEILRTSGRFKERFVMRRKDAAKAKEGQLSFLEKEQKETIVETAEEIEAIAAKPQIGAPAERQIVDTPEPESGHTVQPENGHTAEQRSDTSVFIVENGRIEPVTPDSYMASTLYQTVDSFGVECKLVKPEEPGGMVYEGKKPSKKTVPILVGRDGECVLLNSWEELESDPSRLANASEVLGALPVKQVFVLKRK
ncbi:MAG: hypothetical protein ACP5SH_05785 [Syntrophobacteraceae bacterium]